MVPVRGSDGAVHLAYELLFLNTSDRTMQIDSVAVVDPDDGDRVVGTLGPMATLKGANATGLLRRMGVATSPAELALFSTLEAGKAGVMYLDVIFASRADVPARIAHRVTTSVPDAPGEAPVTAVGGRTSIGSAEAIELGPPLRGDRWLVGDGCCRVLGPHRFTLLPLDGSLRVPEHFAIDFVQLDASGRLYTGDMKVLTNWHFYGAPVVSASFGRVVTVLDGLPDQVPGSLPQGATLQTAAGNHVVVAMGHGRFALYAHLIPGSVAVSEGQLVWPGQRLGALGNSGNTDAPHLHFQVMTTEEPLTATGLPFVFRRWEYQGRLVGTLFDVVEALQAGQPPLVDLAGSGPRRDAMPLVLELVGFPR